MIKGFNKINIFLIAILSLFGVSLLTNNSFAEEEELRTRIQISPTVIRPQLDPGADYKNNFTISNTGVDAFDFELEVSPYFVDKNGITPVYNITNNYTQITRWITIDQNYQKHLEPGESTIVNFEINVPNDAPGGGQYAAIFASTKDESTDAGTVKYINSIGTIISARLSGVTRETGEIVEEKVSNFLLAPPVKASVKFSNTGNVDTEAKVTVDIENALTGEKLFSSKDPTTATVLPETEKTINLEYDNVLRLGIMKLTMRIEYLNEAEVVTRTVIICPIWFIIIIVAIILLIIAKIASKKHSNDKKRSNSRGFENPSKNFNI